MTPRGTTRGGRRWAAAALTGALVLVGHAPLARAQSGPCPPVSGAAGCPGRFELSVGAVGALPAPLGSMAETLTKPDGAPLVVFKASSRFGPSLGGDAQFGYRLTPRVGLEAGGSWTAVRAQTRLSGDIESAPALTATASVSRFIAEGALVWTAATAGRTGLFVRGSGGWLREVTRGVAVVDDAPIGSAGLGVKYWWGNPSARRAGRVALRLEARAVVRAGRPFLADRKLRILPVVVAGLSLGL